MQTRHQDAFPTRILGLNPSCWPFSKGNSGLHFWVILSALVPKKGEATVKPVKRLLDLTAVSLTMRHWVREVPGVAPLSPSPLRISSARSTATGAGAREVRARSAAVGLRGRWLSASTGLLRTPPGTAPHPRPPRSAPFCGTEVTGREGP